MFTGSKAFWAGLGTGAAIAIGAVWLFTIGGDIGQRVIVKDCNASGAFTLEGRTYKCELT